MLATLALTVGTNNNKHQSKTTNVNVKDGQTNLYKMYIFDSWTLKPVTDFTTNYPD